MIEEAPKKQYVSLHEVIAKPEFIEAVKGKIDKLKKQRRNHFKRNYIDRLRSDGELNHEFFIKQFPLILGKKSTLSSEKRAVINFICKDAFMSLLPKQTA